MTDYKQINKWLVFNFKSLATWISDGNSHITKTQIILERNCIRCIRPVMGYREVCLYCFDTLINYAQTTETTELDCLYKMRELTKKRDCVPNLFMIGYKIRLLVLTEILIADRSSSPVFPESEDILCKCRT